MAHTSADTQTTNLKIRVGVHEFEASGPVAVVQAQFEAFKILVQRLDGMDQQWGDADRQPHSGDVLRVQPVDARRDSVREVHEAIRDTLEAIMTRKGRIVSLKVPAASLEDEIALLLLGQQMLRANHMVMGGDLLEGMRQTGRKIRRIDYQLRKLRKTGDVVSAGLRRARRYRLSNPGTERATRLAQALKSTTAPA